jgi:hypothetical protein
MYGKFGGVSPQCYSCSSRLDGVAAWISKTANIMFSTIQLNLSATATQRENEALSKSGGTAV